MTALAYYAQIMFKEHPLCWVSVGWSMPGYTGNHIPTLIWSNRMETIIAGRFDTWEKSEKAIQALSDAHDIKAEDTCSFYVGPAGQHATFPIGGDEHTDPGAGDAHNKGITGGALGAGVAGLAALPAGPIAAATGAVVGAYAGSLLGSLQGMHEKDVSERHAEPLRRSAGVLVAVKIDALSGNEPDVIQTLEAQGAQDIEKTEGQWRSGEWVDFDPVAPLRLIHTPKT